MVSAGGHPINVFLQEKNHEKIGSKFSTGGRA